MDPKDPTREARGDFLSDVKELRRRARQHIEDGAVTPDCGADRHKVIAVLNEATAPRRAQVEGARRVIKSGFPIPPTASARQPGTRPSPVFGEKASVP